MIDLEIEAERSDRGADAVGHLLSLNSNFIPELLELCEANKPNLRAYELEPREAPKIISASQMKLLYMVNVMSFQL